MALDGGQAVGIFRKGKPVGLAMVTTDNDKVFIEEILYDDEGIQNALLWKATVIFGVREAMYQVPPIPSESHRFGMARVLNKEKMIWQWLENHPGLPYSAEEMLQMETEALTGNLLGYEQRESYMSLMLD